jgi:hypothetical protein
MTPAEKKWVDSIIKDGREVYSETFDLIHHLRRVRAMRIKARTPRSFSRIMGKGIRAPMSYSLIQTIVGLVAKNRPKFTRLPRTPREKESAQRLANTAGPTLDALEASARKPLYYLFADQLAGDGRGAIKMRVLPWEGYPIREEGMKDPQYNKIVDDWLASTSSQPIRATLADPLNVMPAREEWDLPYLIEQGHRSTKLTMQRLGIQFDATGKIRELPAGKPVSELEIPRGLGPTIPVEEVWTDDAVYIRVAQSSGYFKRENTLGFIPYVTRFGEMTSIPDPSLEGVSSIFPFLGLEPWLNTMLSVMAAWSVLGSTPILWTARDPRVANAAAAEKIGVSDIPLGRRVDLGLGGQIGFVQPPTVGREVIEYTQLLLSFYDKAGMTPLARGVLGNRTPGLALSAALEAATDKLKPLIGNLESGVAELIQKVWMITNDTIQQPIWVTGEGLVKGRFGVGRSKKRARFQIDPKDIDGYYDLKAEVKLSNLQDVVTQGMHAAFMKQHGLWSDERARRFSGVDDPFEERVEGMRDAFRNHPVVMEYLLRGAINEEPQLKAIADELEARPAPGSWRSSTACWWS